jgi:hypothetical protein
MNRKRNLLSASVASVVLIATVAWYPPAPAMAETAAAPAVALTGPCDAKSDDFHGKPFYEILFMKRNAEGPGGSGNYWNSITHVFDVPDAEVDAKFRALDAKALAKEYGSDGVFFNGPRRFVANGVSGVGYNDCKPRVMGTIPFVLYGTLDVPSYDGFVSGPPVAYKVLTSKRTNSFTWKAGEVVHELVTPEGAVYTMFSLSLKADPNNTIENLPTLGSRLKLPEGWKYRTRTLDADLVISSSYDADPPNTIVLDELEGNYQHNPYAK